MSSIKDFNVHISRSAGNIANEIYVYVTIWSLLSNAEIKNFEAEDLQNHNKEKDAAGVLNLNVHLVRKENSIVLKKPVLVYKVFELKSSELDFKFNKENDFIFLTNIISPEKPTGTKRTVITYEDTDIIDDTIL